MKVTTKEGTHGINKIFEYDNEVKCAAYASPSGYMIHVNGEYVCNLSEEEVDVVCIGGNAVVNSGGDLDTYLQAVTGNKKFNDCTTEDGKYTFSLSNKKSAGGVIAYGRDNDTNSTSRLCSIIKCDPDDLEETEKAIDTAKKICEEACKEYDEIGKFKAYPQCKLEHSYSDVIAKETVQLRIDSHIENKPATLHPQYEDLQERCEKLEIKTHEQEWLLDMYRYDKWEEDSSCPHCNSTLERLYSNKTNSLFIGCPKCKKFSDSYNEHYHTMYKEGYIPDRWVENNLREEF